jgi:hypothetical protein
MQKTLSDISDRVHCLLFLLRRKNPWTRGKGFLREDKKQIDLPLRLC